MADGFGRTAISRRYLLYYAAAFVVAIALLGFFVDRSAREALIEGVETSLEKAASVASLHLPEDPAGLEGWAQGVFEASGYRATLIDSAGVVLAESHSDPAVMENHLGRPEVQQALSGSVGVARRVSASTGFEQLYVALPPGEDGLIVRVSSPVRVIDQSLNALRLAIVAAALTAGLIGVAVVAWIGRLTARPITELTEQALAVASGHLEVQPRRSPVRELDRLGVAISRVAAEQQARLDGLRDAGATLETVLGAIPQGTLLVGPGEDIVYANPSSRRLLGEIPTRLEGLAPLSFQRAVREARETGETVTAVADHGRPTLRLRGVATPLSEDERILLVVIDITERERTDSIRRDFAANASHEMKTPVATIIATSEALRTAVERGDESAVRFAGQIEESARQLDRLVGDLLDLSRLESEVPEPEPVRLDLLVRDEIVRFREKAGDREFAVDITGEPIVLGSHRDLSIAIRNLLDNAVRYADREDRITVTLQATGGHALLTVADEGEGIPSRDLDRVFERFYRVDSARSRSTGGTGLGLAIVKHVAESHGGSVGVESELGVGSTFRMLIPLAAGSAPAEPS